MTDIMNSLTTSMTSLVLEPNKLQDVFDFLQKQLTLEMLKDILSKLHAIRSEFTGDGAGLSGGIVIDKFLTAYLSVNISSFEEYHIGESDCKILDHPLSLKKINGKSTIALDWSKNGEDSKKRERFDTDMMIINLKEEQWWKSAPKSANKEEVDSKFFSTPIQKGIYFVSHTYCKSEVCLSSNNKTNSLIKDVALYKMLKNSIKNNMFIEFPNEYNEMKFDILKAFH